MYHSMCGGLKDPLLSLSTICSWESNPNHQDWQKVLLPVELSCCPCSEVSVSVFLGGFNS